MFKECKEKDFNTDKSMEFQSTLNTDVNEKEIPTCPYCKNLKTIKFGYQKTGAPRFKCSKCRKTFSKTTKTIMSHSRLNKLNNRDEFIEDVINKLPVHEISKKYSVNKNTVSLWKSKIEALKNHISSSNSNEKNNQEMKLSITTANEINFNITRKELASRYFNKILNDIGNIFSTPREFTIKTNNMDETYSTQESIFKCLSINMCSKTFLKNYSEALCNITSSYYINPIREFFSIETKEEVTYEKKKALIKKNNQYNLKIPENLKKLEHSINDDFLMYINYLSSSKYICKENEIYSYYYGKLLEIITEILKYSGDLNTFSKKVLFPMFKELIEKVFNRKFKNSEHSIIFDFLLKEEGFFTFCIKTRNELIVKFEEVLDQYNLGASINKFDEALIQKKEALYTNIHDPYYTTNNLFKIISEKYKKEKDIYIDHVFNRFSNFKTGKTLLNEEEVRKIKYNIDDYVRSLQEQELNQSENKEKVEKNYEKLHIDGAVFLLTGKLISDLFITTKKIRNSKTLKTKLEKVLKQHLKIAKSIDLLVEKNSNFINSVIK